MPNHTLRRLALRDANIDEIRSEDDLIFVHVNGTKSCAMTKWINMVVGVQDCDQVREVIIRNVLY
jgi:hypothetical protein